jgi:hypothetical protein
MMKEGEGEYHAPSQLYSYTQVKESNHCHKGMWLSSADELIVPFPGDLRNKTGF